MIKKWSVGWGVEEKCNMRCEFCYSKEVRKNISKMGIKTYTDFIDNNHEFISSINYGTGENSLSATWFELVKYIGENYPNIKQALTTNGHISKACLNTHNLDTFVKYIDEIDVSLDFSSKERHNRFRGSSEAYDMALSTLQLCKSYDKKTTIVFLGTNEVVKPDNLAGIFEIANKFNSYLRTNIYRPTQGINEISRSFILDYSNLINMLQWVSQRHKIIKVSDQLLSAFLFKKEVIDLSGFSSLRILGDGSITPSTYLISEKYRKYNIKTEGLNLLNVNFSDIIIPECIPSSCVECPHVGLCKGGVFDRRILWYGILSERDPYCPLRYPEIDYDGIKLIEDSNFSSIHDSYLPTIFFAV